MRERKRGAGRGGRQKEGHRTNVKRNVEEGVQVGASVVGERGTGGV